MNLREMPSTPPPTSLPEAASTPEKTGILWTKEIFIPENLYTSFHLGEKQIFASNTDGFPLSFQLTTGEKLWQWKEKGAIYGAEPILHPKRLYVLEYPGNQFWALEASTGSEEFKTVFEEIDFTRYGLDPFLYLTQETIHLNFRPKSYPTTDKPFFTTLDKQDGQILWQSKKSAEIRGKSGQTLLVLIDASHNKELFGIHPKTSEIKWYLPVNTLFLLPLEPDSFIYIYRKQIKDSEVRPEYEYFVAAAELDTGAKLWETEPFKTHVGNVHFSFAWPRTIYIPRARLVVDSQTGNKLWQWQPKEEFAGETKGMLLLSSLDQNYTRVVEIPTGAERWKRYGFNINSLIGINNNALIGAHYYIPDYDPAPLYSVDLETGKPNWTRQLPKTTFKPILFRDKLIFGTGNKIIAWDPETGNPISEPIQLPGIPSNVRYYQNLLFAQTGTPGGRGTLSAVKI